MRSAEDRRGRGRDATFVLLPEPDAATLEVLWQRVVLAECARQGRLEAEAAAALLAGRTRRSAPASAPGARGVSAHRRDRV